MLILRMKGLKEVVQELGVEIVLGPDPHLDVYHKSEMKAKSDQEVVQEPGEEVLSVAGN